MTFCHRLLLPRRYKRRNGACGASRELRWGFVDRHDKMRRENITGSVPQGGRYGGLMPLLFSTAMLELISIRGSVKLR